MINKLNKQKEGGIFGFISNNSFLDNPTFRGMRYSLLKSFDKIYILDLHGNVRKKKISPDGSKDENVFDIMQGVSINIFIKNAKNQNNNVAVAHCVNGSKKSSQGVTTPCYSENKALAKVYHYDLFGKREDKYKFLFDNNLDNIEWKELKFEAPFFLFVPQNEIIKSEYDRGISVKDMFRISGVGITTAHDDFVIDADKEKLLQKFNDFKNSYPNADELHEKFNVAKKDGWDILKGWKKYTRR